MALPAPDLDDRRWADIVDEARTLIPRYTPEWDNHNQSDPGITLVELFAWLAEMLLYRLNQVPERLHIKFLELLGVRLRPAEPARAELTFALVDPPPRPVVTVPKGTQVAAAGTDGQPPAVFETDRTLLALGGRLAVVLGFDGFSYTQETRANAAGDHGWYPFGRQPRPGGALLLGLDTPGAFPELALDLAITVSADSPSVQGVTCDPGSADLPAQAELRWEHWNGSGWAGLSLDRDDTRTFGRSGHVVVRVPGPAMVRLALDDVAQPYYWLRARVERAGWERPPRLDEVALNTVPTTQAETVQDEVLGGTDGLPDQTFQLFSAPVLAGSLVLEIDEGSGFQRWTEVDDFYGSDPDDRHHLLDRATGLVTMPDGQRGRIPVANPANPQANVVARVYRHGGGQGGNLPAGAITQLQGAVDGIDTVTNRRVAEGGADAETVEDAKVRVAEELRSRNRAVTAEDFEFLARATPGARIARALARGATHPAFPGVPVPGTVTVIVVPDRPGPAPVPSEAAVRAVCRQLDRHRLLTTEVHVVGPRYRGVRVDADVLAEDTADLGAVRQGVEDALARHFHPLTGGQDGHGWPLGGDIFYSLVAKEVLDVAGVARIGRLDIFLDDERQPFCQDAPVGPGVLLASEAHDIQVRYR
jgi:predicted phage baseplate assembly protein